MNNNREPESDLWAWLGVAGLSLCYVILGTIDYWSL
jgi:hypothetical protein